MREVDLDSDGGGGSALAAAEERRRREMEDFRATEAGRDGADEAATEGGGDGADEAATEPRCDARPSMLSRRCTAAFVTAFGSIGMATMPSRRMADARPSSSERRPESVESVFRDELPAAARVLGCIPTGIVLSAACARDEPAAAARCCAVDWRARHIRSVTLRARKLGVRPTVLGGNDGGGPGGNAGLCVDKAPS